MSRRGKVTDTQFSSQCRNRRIQISFRPFQISSARIQNSLSPLTLQCARKAGMELLHMNRVLAESGLTRRCWRTMSDLARLVCREGMRPRTRFHLSILLLAACTAAVGHCEIAAAQSAEHWVGTWATAPQAFMPGALETFDNQTVRLIVHIGIGGSKTRIRISNIHGTEALNLGAVHVALADSGADISSGTDHAVTF